MKQQALQYYMHDGPSAFRFELSGSLNDEGARRLDQDWRTASSVIGDRRLIVDITFVTDVGVQGRALLARWHGEGAEIVANTKASRELAESVIGQQLPNTAENPARKPVSRQTWAPFRTFFVGVVAALLASPVSAATLKKEAINAWNQYVARENATLQERIHSANGFMWTFENADRAGRVRNGEIVVEPASPQVPKKVPGGLIHHWIGAIFIPNVNLDDVFAVTRDYDRYRDIYHPGVIESKCIARNGSEDKFSMILMNKSFFLKSALDADYQSTNIRLGRNRAYSISNTTRVQEVEDFGQPGEHLLPPGEGGGYIWKLYSMARLEQRDGGVYVELEAMALSRDIPALLHVFVDPVVRRVSRNSLLTSLQQTEEAARGNAVVAARVNAPSSHIALINTLH